MLEAVLGTVFGVDDKIAEEFVHVGFENVSEVDWVVDLCKNQHKILQMPTLVSLLIRGVQIIIMKDLKDLESILKNTRQYLTLVSSEAAFIGNHVVNRLERLKFSGRVSVRVLSEECFGDLVGQDDALLQQFSLDFLHV